MPEYVRCNLCNNDFYEVLHPSTLENKEIIRPEDIACSNLGHGRHYRIVRCKKCGLIYSNPRDPAELIENCYKRVRDERYYKASAGRIKTFNRLLRHLEKHKTGKSLSDVGCYTGIFMKLALSRGWSVLGVEPSKWASEIARKKYGLNVINASIYEIKALRDKFDVITMWDVIEHFRDPSLALEICHKKLSDNGIIAISTMRCQGLFYFLSGRNWPWFMRMHLYYFTVETLSKMLEKTGFKLLDIHPYTHYINLEYFFYKISLINKRFSFLSNSKILSQIIFPIQLGDFIEVYAVKV